MKAERYRLSPAARADLAAIWHHSAETWLEDQADRYVDSLVATFEMLARFPEIARERPEFTPPVRLHPSGEHLVIYHLNEPEVVILRVLHGRQDIPGALDS